MKWKTTEHGAATSVLVATSPLLDGIGRAPFRGLQRGQGRTLSARNGVAEYALDPDAAAHLWQVSIKTLAS